MQLVVLADDLTMSEKITATVIGLKPQTVYCIIHTIETSLGKLYQLHGTYRNSEGEYMKSSSKFSNVPEHYVVEFNNKIDRQS